VGDDIGGLADQTQQLAARRPHGQLKVGKVHVDGDECLLELVEHGVTDTAGAGPLRVKL
jgi:hypothetical protein